MNNEKIIYIAPFKSSFIEQDIQLLRKENRVYVDSWNWKNKLWVLPNMFLQFFTLIFYVFTYKTIIISFGGYWSVVPSLMGKIFKNNVFIILNGTDCASIPSYNYGSLRKNFLKKAISISYKNTTSLLAVSKSLVKTDNYYGLSDYEKYQGIRVHFPELKTPINVIYNGYDYNYWKMEKPHVKEPNSFIAVFSEKQFYLKGGDLIVELAQIFPTYKFYIAGLAKPKYLDNTIENIIFLGYLPKDKLKYYFNISSFHFQLSVFEGFGGALCEAMLCECIPIGSSVNMIPEIIGDSGYILEKKDINLLEKIIAEIQKDNSLEIKRKMARERIKNNYNLELRRNELLQVIRNSS